MADWTTDEALDLDYDDPRDEAFAMAKRRKKPKVDENWLASVTEELREAGCDEMFITCTIEELREGGSVTVYTSGREFRFGEDTDE